MFRGASGDRPCDRNGTGGFRQWPRGAFAHRPRPLDLFADTIGWLRAHLNEPVTVSDLAARAAMSPRTFARRFLASTGTTPLAWIVRERIGLAQRLLETSDLPTDVIARESGFGSPDNLRKHFGRALRTTPQAYRQAFLDPPARGLSGASSLEP